MKHVVILGGGTGGTLVANRLLRQHDPHELMITVVDQDDQHVYQPGLLFVPFGLTHGEDLVRSRHRQLHDGIAFRQVGVDHVDVAANQVHFEDGSVLAYDVLIIATGAVLVPEETEGLAGPGWMEKVFTFYNQEGAAGTGPARKLPSPGVEIRLLVTPDISEPPLTGGSVPANCPPANSAARPSTWRSAISSARLSCCCRSSRRSAKIPLTKAPTSSSVLARMDGGSD